MSHGMYFISVTTAVKKHLKILANIFSSSILHHVKRYNIGYTIPNELPVSPTDFSCKYVPLDLS